MDVIVYSSICFGMVLAGKCWGNAKALVNFKKKHDRYNPFKGISSFFYLTGIAFGLVALIYGIMFLSYNSYPAIYMVPALLVAIFSSFIELAESDTENPDDTYLGYLVRGNVIGANVYGALLVILYHFLPDAALIPLITP
jgi:hypothetical protein